MNKIDYRDVLSWGFVSIILVSLITIAVVQVQMLKFLEYNAYEPEFDPCDLQTVICNGEGMWKGSTSTPQTSQNDDAEALRAYLVEKGAYELAEHSEAIVELERWEEVVAIANAETSLCTAGVGSSQNNCGAIKSWKTERVFKQYENVFDSMWDIAFLLQKPRYKGKTIDEWNGSYCYDESQPQGKCINWTESITAVSEELKQLAYGN